MLHAGILESSIIPPEDAINLAATELPTISQRLGATVSIWFLINYIIFCLLNSIEITWLLKL
jgi:uncharacterized membrane protein (DUF485 family)